MRAPDPHDKQQRSDEMTALINNYKADTLTPWTHKHAIRHGLRFGDDGELHPELFRFAANLRHQLSRTRTLVLKDGEIDPYLWVDMSAIDAVSGQDVEARHIDASNVHVIRHW